MNVEDLVAAALALAAAAYLVRRLRPARRGGGRAEVGAGGDCGTCGGCPLAAAEKTEKASDIQEVGSCADSR